jgi:hypothetical protein
MRTIITLFTVLATTSIAAAEPAATPHGRARGDKYIGIGAEAGVQRELMSGGYVDAGMRVSDSPIFLRARITGGFNGANGSYQQARVGGEGRGCVARGWVCGFLGLDVGLQHDKLDGEGVFAPSMTYEDNYDALAVPRAGVEVGKAVRVRASFETPLRMALDSGYTGNGAAASLGVGYTF